MATEARNRKAGGERQARAQETERPRSLKRLTPAMVARLAAIREEISRGRTFQDTTEIIRQAHAERFDEL